MAVGLHGLLWSTLLQLPLEGFLLPQEVRQNRLTPKAAPMECGPMNVDVTTTRPESELNPVSYLIACSSIYSALAVLAPFTRIAEGSVWSARPRNPRQTLGSSFALEKRKRVKREKEDYNNQAISAGSQFCNFSSNFFFHSPRKFNIHGRFRNLTHADIEGLL